METITFCPIGKLVMLWSGKLQTVKPIFIVGIFVLGILYIVYGYMEL